MGCCGACGGQDKAPAKTQNQDNAQSSAKPDAQPLPAVNQFVPEPIEKK
ncbi:hypothetical protein ACFOEE_10005 [Pseudoalteromonas fenneropenaei]|uniref:Uncharacterized protein n=1 Tax=Pseudoalteromonas fenneropenaei TaxID=1737459 RepID=A0ABV7CJR3_9GAMM